MSIFVVYIYIGRRAVNDLMQWEEALQSVADLVENLPKSNVLF